MAAEHTVLSHDEWVQAHKAFLAREKEFTRQRAALAQDRRDLPWEAVTKAYVFDGPAGKATLPDLFDGCRQLVIYHFMFGPGWEEGCPHCSFWADHFDSVSFHIGQRDTAFAVVSRAPWKEIAPFKKRMGWKFEWVSSFGTDFNFDFNVSFTPEQLKNGTAIYNFRPLDMDIDEREGVSALYRDKNGAIYRTYSSYERGIDLMNTTYNFLDLTAKGRDENPESTQDWVRYHDQYKGVSSHCCCS